MGATCYTQPVTPVPSVVVQNKILSRSNRVATILFSHIINYYIIYVRKIFPSLNRFLSCLNRFYPVRTGFIQFAWVLFSLTGSYPVWTDFYPVWTDFYPISNVCIQFCSVLSSMNRLYRVRTGFIQFESDLDCREPVLSSW